MKHRFQLVIKLVGKKTAEELKKYTLAYTEKHANLPNPRIIIADTKFEFGITMAR